MAQAQLSGSTQPSTEHTGKRAAARACADVFKLRPGDIERLSKLRAAPAEPAQDAQLLLCLLHVPAFLQKAVSERAAQQCEARAFLASETQAQGLVGFPAAGATLQGSSQDIHRKRFFLSEHRAFSFSRGCLGTLSCMTRLHRVWREELGPERIEVANHLNT